MLEFADDVFSKKKKRLLINIGNDDVSRENGPKIIPKQSFFFPQAKLLYFHCLRKTRMFL